MALCNSYFQSEATRGSLQAKVSIGGAVIFLTFYHASACITSRTRYCFTISVRLFVCPLPVLCLNECTYRRFFFDILVGASFLFLSLTGHRRYKIPRGTPSAAALNTPGGNFCDFQSVMLVAGFPVAFHCIIIIGVWL